MGGGLIFAFTTGVHSDFHTRGTLVLAAVLVLALWAPAAQAEGGARKGQVKPGLATGKRGNFSYKRWAEKRRWDKPAHVARLQLNSAKTPLPEFDPVTLAARPIKDPKKAAASIDGASVERLTRRLQRVDGSGVRKTRMKAFERLVRRHAPGQPFKRLYVVSELHLLDSMKDLLEGMVDGGALESRLILQGVRHSQQADVISEMQRWGIRTRPARVEDMDQQFKQLALGIVRKANKDPNARFLVVGHGGRVHEHLTRLLDKPGVPADLVKRVSIVETTRKGALRMESLWRRMARAGMPAANRKYRFPVVDIGEHWAKVHFESPTIGQGVANAMRRHLMDLTSRGVRGLDVAVDKVPVLIVGYGAVGRATARMLRQQGYEVHVHDLKFARPGSRLMKQARRDGVVAHTSLSGALASNPRVIGSATGAKPWTGATVPLIPRGAVLFNLASPGEMDGLTQATRARQASGGGAGSVQFGGRLLGLRQVAPDHRDSVLITAGKELLMARGGQVINLAEGGKEPPEYIQVTRGLVWLSALKGARLLGAKPGRHRLDDAEVKRFVNDVQGDLRGAGLGPLQRPTF